MSIVPIIANIKIILHGKRLGQLEDVLDGDAENPGHLEGQDGEWLSLPLLSGYFKKSDSSSLRNPRLIQ